MYVQINYPSFMALDNNGLFAVGYEIHTFVAGSVATPMTTYYNKDLAPAHANTNPIILDARGEANIFVGSPVKLVFTVPGGNPASPIKSWDYQGEQRTDLVTGSATPGTTNNNYVVTVTPALLALSNNLMLIMTPDVDNTDTIVSQAFTGTGINDGVFTGPYIGSTSGSVFTAQIDNTSLSPPGAPTAALSATAGVVTAGNHYAKVTFVNAAGESVPGTASGVVAADGTHKIDLTNIPTGTGDVTSRKIYMTKAGGSTYYYVDVIPDNSTVIYSINVADAGLTVAAPSTNTSYDSFKWKKDGGAWTAKVAITGSAQILIEDVAITFAVLTGHTFGDLWAVTVKTPARVNLSALGNLIVYKNKGGSIVALDGTDMKAGYPAQLIMNAALNAWLLINPATPTFSTPTISAVRYRKNLTTTYALLLADQGYELSCVGTFSLNLCTPPTFSGRFVYIKNAGTGIITLDAGIYTIYGIGLSTLLLGPGMAVQLQSNGVDWHVITSTGGLSLVGYKNETAATTTTFPNLVPGVRYRLMAQLQHLGDGHVLSLQFNGDTAGHYEFSNLNYNSVDTVILDYATGEPSIRLECVGVPTIGSNTGFMIEFITEDGNNKAVSVTGQCSHRRAEDLMAGVTINGRWYSGAADLSSVSVIMRPGGTANFTGKLYLYQYG